MLLKQLWIFRGKGCGYSLWWITIKRLSFSFVSRCSHVWCRSRRFDCILLVFFRRWGRLVMRDLIKHDALLWLVVFHFFSFFNFEYMINITEEYQHRKTVPRVAHAPKVMMKPGTNKVAFPLSLIQSTPTWFVQLYWTCMFNVCATAQKKFDAISNKTAFNKP